MRAPLFLLATLVASLPALADKPTMLPGTMPSLNQGRGSLQRFAPAPVPNPDLVAPRSQRDPNSLELFPGLTRTPSGQSLGGDGFSRGSAYSGDLERRTRGGVGSTLARSLNLKMPVQVEFR